MFLLAPVFVLIPDDPDLVVRIALPVLAACETGVMLLICSWVRRRGGSELAAALVAGCWAFNPYFVRVSLGGLETSLAALAAAATLFRLDAIRQGNRDAAPSLLGLGVLLGLAFLARVDNVFLIPVLALALAVGPVPAWRRLLRRWALVGPARQQSWHLGSSIPTATRGTSIP